MEKYNLMKESDKILTMLLESESETESSNEDSVNEEEEVNEVLDSNHNSDSEQEANSESTTDNEEIGENVPYIYGKDKVTKWERNELPQNVRTRTQNIVIHLPGCKGAAKTVNSISGCFELFFDSVILNSIVCSTNTYICSIRSKFDRERDAKATDLAEIKSLIGLLILAGVNRSGRQNTNDLWDQSGFGVEIFPVSMSLQRFRFLLRCLRFDNMHDRAGRRTIDKLAPIRELYELFVHNCKRYYSLSEYVCIDEMLVKFRGRCPFRQYIPSKPGKYGIKMFAMVDARTMYTSNFEIYVGKQPEGPYIISNSPSDVVMRLIEPIEGTGRNITTDNWYTSIPIANELLLKKN